jgi:hypothetical protein
MKASEQQRQRKQFNMKTTTLRKTGSIVLALAFLAANSVQAGKATRVPRSHVPSAPKVAPVPRPAPPAVMPKPRPQDPYVGPGPRHGGGHRPVPPPPPGLFPKPRPQDPYVGPGPRRGGRIHPVPPAPRASRVNRQTVTPWVTAPSAASVSVLDTNLLGNGYLQLPQADSAWSGH